MATPPKKFCPDESEAFQTRLLYSVRNDDFLSDLPRVRDFSKHFGLSHGSNAACAAISFASVISAITHRDFAAVIGAPGGEPL